MQTQTESILEYISKEWNLLNICKEWDASNFSCCETWDINLHFIQVLQLTWISRIVPGNNVPGEKKAKFFNLPHSC